VDLSDLVFGERHIPENNIRIAVKLLRDFIPAWGLLDSSSSALRGNPPNEHGLAGIDI